MENNEHTEQALLIHTALRAIQTRRKPELPEAAGTWDRILSAFLATATPLAVLREAVRLAEIVEEHGTLPEDAMPATVPCVVCLRPVAVEWPNRPQEWDDRRQMDRTAFQCCQECEERARALDQLPDGTVTQSARETLEEILGEILQGTELGRFLRDD